MAFRTSIKHTWDENRGSLLITIGVFIALIGCFVIFMHDTLKPFWTKPRITYIPARIGEDEPASEEYFDGESVANVDTESADLAAGSELANPDQVNRPSRNMSIVVNIDGFKDNNGNCMLALYSTASSFNKPDKALALLTVPIKDRTATAQWMNLTPGIYAVAAYQDLNANGQLDKSAIGYPTEPYGFSSAARATLGPPSFSQASFELNNEPAVVKITVK